MPARTLRRAALGWIIGTSPQSATFLDGAGYVLDLFGVAGPTMMLAPDPNAADALAARQDWEEVGQDLAFALTQAAPEAGAHR